MSAPVPSDRLVAVGGSAHATPAIDADGFFRTGDLCSIDTAGRLRYHGRLADMLFGE